MNEKIFWSTENIFPVAPKMISIFAKVFCISPKIFFNAKKMIGAIQKCF